MGVIILANGEGGVGMAAAISALAEGRLPLDAVEAGIRVVERDPGVRSVGFGGAPNILGEMECDAAIMCGRTRRTGAVGALKDYMHAISIARQVMERTPHVMIVGEGARRFAGEMGAEKAEMLSDEARAAYEKWLARHVPSAAEAGWPDVPLAPLVRPPMVAGEPRGTVAFLVRTCDGSLAGGVSTSGWAYKYPGRISDSCIIGAGLYVDDRYGAAACTHTGEMIIRAGLARAVVTYMQKGAAVDDASREAFDDLKTLKGGTLGPVILHAMDADGNLCVLTTGNDGDIPYWLWREGMSEPERHMPARRG
jgi:beta-aspartyl-peptidase (threonine type)